METGEQNRKEFEELKDCAGRAVMLLRRARGNTRSLLSSLLRGSFSSGHMTEEWLADIETGKNHFSFEEFEVICKALHCSIGVGLECAQLVRAESKRDKTSS